MLVHKESLLLGAGRLESSFDDELLLFLEDVVSLAKEALADIQGRLQSKVLCQGEVLGDLRIRNPGRIV